MNDCLRLRKLSKNLSNSRCRQSFCKSVSIKYRTGWTQPAFRCTSLLPPGWPWLGLLSCRRTSLSVRQIAHQESRHTPAVARVLPAVPPVFLLLWFYLSVLETCHTPRPVNRCQLVFFAILPMEATRPPASQVASCSTRQHRTWVESVNCCKNLVG